jgi:hypothetical protein
MIEHVVASVLKVNTSTNQITPARYEILFSD